MLSLSWLACHRGDKPKANRQKLAVEEITPDRQKVAGRLIKEEEVPLGVGGYVFMPIRSDSTVYLRYGLTRNEIKLLEYDFDLSLKTSHSFIRGKGPGEWVVTPEIIGYENIFLMMDAPENRITWFDGQMNIIRTFRNQFPVGEGNYGLYGELVPKGNGEFGLFYYIKKTVRGKLDFFYGHDLKIVGGTLSPKGLDSKVYYQTFMGIQKTNAYVFEAGEKLIFAQAGDSLYVIDADTYTLTRMSLDGVPIRSVQVKAERPVFSKEALHRWEKGFSGKKKDSHAGAWNPTYWYPSPLWPVAGLMELGRGIAVITCTDYDPENQPELLRVDYFDLDLHYLGIVEIPSFPRWNCPMVWHRKKEGGVFRWQKDRLFHIHVDNGDEDQITLSRWRFE